MNLLLITEDAVIGGTIGMVGLTITIIGVAVKYNEMIALARQENKFTKVQLDKLEVRVKELEDTIYEKLDKIQDSIESIKVTLAKYSE